MDGAWSSSKMTVMKERFFSEDQQLAAALMEHSSKIYAVFFLKTFALKNLEMALC
jgi:hypothetical protein